MAKFGDVKNYKTINALDIKLTHNE